MVLGSGVSIGAVPLSGPCLIPKGDYMKSTTGSLTGSSVVSSSVKGSALAGAAPKAKAKPRAARKPRATTMDARVRKVRKVSEPQTPQADPVQSAGTEFGAALAGFLYGDSEAEAMTNIVSGSTPGESPRPRSRGLTLEELSELLRRREEHGRESGAQETSDRLYRNFRMRSARDRQEAVAGTLLFVVRQLAPVVERMAKSSDASVVKSQRLELAEMLAAMSRHAQRLADGEERLSGGGEF